MAQNLTGTKIKDTYPGLIKTIDSGPLGLTASALTDGLGNILPLELSITDVNFTGNVDFSGATVSGLVVPAGPQGFQGPAGVDGAQGPQGFQGPGAAGGEPGLILGSVANSMQSAPFLTINPATASVSGAIALGNGARAAGVGSVAIGQGAITTDGIGGGDFPIAIGEGAFSSYVGDAARPSIAIGRNARALYGHIAIGSGHSQQFGSARGVMIGHGTRSNEEAVSLGDGATANGVRSVAIGDGASSAGEASVAIGRGASSSATTSVAIGNQVVASIAGYTTTRKLQLINTVEMDYADDAAAATAGVPVGGIYHTAGVLKIRLS